MKDKLSIKSVMLIVLGLILFGTSSGVLGANTSSTPNVIITANDYNGLWHNTDFTVTLTATNGLNEIVEIHYKINDDPPKTVGIDGQPFMTAESADNKLEYWSVDSTGNEESPHKLLEGIKLDKTAPIGSIQNCGDDWTTSTPVTLTLFYSDLTSGVYQVRLSNDGIWDSEPWENPSITKIWTLTSGDGTNSIYYQIKDNAGLISRTYSTTIEGALKQVRPKPTQELGIDNTGPIVNAGPDRTVNEDAPMILDASASSASANITIYTWIFTDVTNETLTGERPTHIFNTPGVYTISLKVEDAAGKWATDTMAVTVLDVTKPEAKVGQDQTVNVGSPVTFDPSGSTDNVGIVSCEWNFGDGTTGTGKTSHAYINPGIYTATLTVEDRAKNSGTQSVTVTVLSTEAFSNLEIAIVISAIVLTVSATVLLRKTKRNRAPSCSPI